MIQQLLFQSSFCFGTVTFFGAATYGTITSFLQLFFFFRRPSFSERNFYRAPTSWEKKIGSFREANLLKDHKGLGGLSCSDKRHAKELLFWSSYFNVAWNLSEQLRFGISQKWDQRTGTFDGTQDPRPKNHLITGTLKPRPGTLKVGTKT